MQDLYIRRQKLDARIQFHIFFEQNEVKKAQNDEDYVLNEELVQVYKDMRLQH